MQEYLPQQYKRGPWCARNDQGSSLLQHNHDCDIQDITGKYVQGKNKSWLAG